MKPYAAFMIVIFFGIAGILLIMYLVFRSGTSLVSNIDGNKENKNYSTVTGDYAIFNTEQSLCQYMGDRYERIIGRVDSLNWNEKFIIGYNRSGYFVVDTELHQVLNYSSRDNINALYILPSGSMTRIPRLK